MSWKFVHVWPLIKLVLWFTWIFTNITVFFSHIAVNINCTIHLNKLIWVVILIKSFQFFLIIIPRLTWMGFTIKWWIRWYITRSIRKGFFYYNFFQWIKWIVPEIMLITSEKNCTSIILLTVCFYHVKYLWQMLPNFLRYNRLPFLLKVLCMRHIFFVLHLINSGWYHSPSLHGLFTEEFYCSFRPIFMAV